MQNSGNHHDPVIDIEELPTTRGLRVWCDDFPQFPEAVKSLLIAANEQELTPSAILFEFCDSGDGIWSIALLGED